MCLLISTHLCRKTKRKIRKGARSRSPTKESESALQVSTTQNEYSVDTCSWLMPQKIATKYSEVVLQRFRFSD